MLRKQPLLPGDLSQTHYFLTVPGINKRHYECLKFSVSQILRVTKYILQRLVIYIKLLLMKINSNPIILAINSNFSKISNLPIHKHKSLANELSYTVGNDFVGFKKKKSLLSRHGSFPSGLLVEVVEWCEQNKIQFEVVDKRTKPKASSKLFTLNLGCTPYEEQLKAVEACYEYEQGIVEMPTGSGKSITMALLVNKLQLKTLIVVPNLELKRQLRESFTRYFGNLDNIRIENIDSKSLKTCTDFDVLIIDESHHVAAQTYLDLNKNNWGSMYYRYFFTATPFRSNKEEQILFKSLAGELIYRLDYHTAVEKGFIVPVEAYFIDIPKNKNYATHWATMYSELVVNNKVRNDIIVNLLSALKSENKSTLCLVKEIKHGNTLSSAASIFFANGQDENSPDLISFFSHDKIKTLIGTTGVLGEGVDTKPCEYVIITGLGKSKTQFLQQCGRGVRRYPGKESCKVIIFRDASHKWTLAHFREQCRILKEIYDIEPIKLDVGNT